MDLAQQLDRLQRTDPDFQSIMEHARRLNAPRELAHQVALVFFIEMVEAYKESIVTEAAITGKMPVIAYPSPQVDFFVESGHVPPL